MLSLALCSAFFISGNRFAAYCKTFGKGLGLGVLMENPYLQIVGLALPHILKKYWMKCVKMLESRFVASLMRNWVARRELLPPVMGVGKSEGILAKTAF